MAWGEDQGCVALLTRLARDPLVVRYIGDRKSWSPERIDQVTLWAAEHWRANGFGWLVATERGSGQALGFAALNLLGEGTAGLDPGELEVGWWFLPEAWGRGFATEAAGALCVQAFEHVGAPSIIARVQPANIASLAVAERLGMWHELDTTGRFGETLAVHRLLASDWPGAQTRYGQPRKPS